MRLDKLRLQNYRCFGAFEIDFDPHLTILIASNGGGKTTILDAARVALWPFIKGFDLGSQAGNSATIQIEDVRLAQFSRGNMEPQVPCAIEAWGAWSDSALQEHWLQQRVSLKKATNTLGDGGTRALNSHGKGLQEQVRSDAPVTLPMVTYLGTSRLWYEGRFTSAAAQTTLDKSEYSRTSGYLNCLAYSSSFKTFTAWYSWIYRSYREAQLIGLERNTQLSDTGQRFEQIIAAIKGAIDQLLKNSTGWHSLEYSASHQQQLVMHHPEQGVLPVDMLSDGLRNTISMVADLAFRACKLNPHLGERAPLETPGIALIDEVDMFLHPHWQQTIIGSLRAAFPAMQFIVTTHSPQVLSTVRRENIRVIGKDAEGQLIASQPLAMTYGEPSNSVLHSVMQVDPQPPVDEKKDLLQLTEWVDKGRYDEGPAVALMRKLTEELGEQHPQLQRLATQHQTAKGIERMRMIRKRAEVPRQLIQAHANPPTTHDTATSRWKSFRRHKKPVLDALLVEQYGLCCYSEIRPDRVGLGFHIEHVENKSQHPQRTFDYSNLAACALDSQNDLPALKTQGAEVFGGHALGKSNGVDITRLYRVIRPTARASSPTCPMVVWCRLTGCLLRMKTGLATLSACST